ncbi:MAG TPA: polyprenol monophosphomannose synthase [Chitinophagales bacterium]|nr:polyprenol monophosphomannose synthase [Chitinophagales bacterium]
MSDSIVLIPTYNEKENIAAMVEKVFSLAKEFHLLVIDDNSPDGTAGIVKQLIAEKYESKLFLEERQGKLGLGTAYIHGFKWALARQYEYIFEMDADFSHNPDDLMRLYHTCAHQNADIAIGSRYVKGGSVANWPLDRILLSWFASLYVRLITWMPVYDTTAGFVCYRRKVLETLNLSKIRSIGYGFQIEMKFASWKLGFKLKEIPITFADRMYGVSKMSSSIFKEAALGVIKMKWQSFFKNYAQLQNGSG